jgi:hypothetical protein
MIELLAVQAVTTAALAFFVIKLRRELYPMTAAAGPTYASFWIRSVDVLVVETPQLKAAKTVIRVRWLFSEELYLIHRLRVYDVALHPYRRHHYVRWKAWMQGDGRYKCEVEKPRGLARLYNKAIDVFCREVKKDEKKEVVILPSRWRKRRYKRWRKPRPRRERATLYDLVEKFEKLK